MDYVLVFIGGGIGAAARYFLSGFVYRFLDPAFPYGTLCVNLVGSLLIGMLMGFFEERFAVQASLRIFLTVGVLGGFTTFSTFSYETVALMQHSEYLFAVLNVVLSLTLCLAGAWFGINLGKMV